MNNSTRSLPEEPADEYVSDRWVEPHRGAQQA
jgi:hypothetical protein